MQMQIILIYFFRGLLARFFLLLRPHSYWKLQDGRFVAALQLHLQAVLRVAAESDCAAINAHMTVLDGLNPRRRDLRAQRD